MKCSSSNREVIEKMVEARKNSSLQKYGVGSYTQTEEFREKAKAANIEKYGVANPQQNEEIRNKSKITNILRYGHEIASKNEDVIEKAKCTKFLKYGDRNYNNSKLSKKTKSDKYGDENYINIDKIKKTCIREYGVDNVSKSDTVKEKIRKNHLEKFYALLTTNLTAKSIATPLFTFDEYRGVYSDDNRYLYKFNCKTCNNDFECKLGNGLLPRCTFCYPKSISIPQSEIFDYIKSIAPDADIIQNTRNVIYPLEIDIYSPSKRLAIEFNGIYWHGEISGGKDKNYHLNKTINCQINGIRLFHIFGWEWINKKEIIRSMISNEFGKNTVIYVNECIIKEVAEEDKNIFLENNHLSGRDGSSIKLGLYYNNELVYIMTFSELELDGCYELCRYAAVVNTSIVGAASTLFSWFVEKHTPKSIVSYCDRRHLNSAVCIDLGMRLVVTSDPTYQYFHKKDCVPINRSEFRKNKLQKLLIYDSDLTEWQNMQLNGYDRIWDCGELKYQWGR